MEIRNLNTFLQVASMKNFTKAAREMGYSQSNVSAQIKKLEEELGQPLFDRIGKNVFLTTYGEALLPYAREAVSAIYNIENLMREKDRLEGVIKIGITDSLSELLLEKALVSYHEDFPRVRLEFSTDPAASLLDQLQEGILDAACLIGDPLSSGKYTVLYSVPSDIVIVANSAHPLSQKKSISVSDIPGSELILMEGSASYSRQFQNYIAEQGIQLEPFLRLQSADTARRLVENNNFISILPSYTVARSVMEGKLRILPVTGWKCRQWIQIVIHQGKAVTPQITGFLEALKNILEHSFV